nr:nucleolar protein 8 [Arachis hypogaea]
MEGQHNKLVRIFVGGLGESITKQDLHSLLSSFGNVEAVETIRTKGRSFAYLDFLPSPTDDKSLSRLFSKYNGCVWKGGKLKLEKVKEHYLVRLKRQWDEDAMSKIEHVSDKPATTDKLEKKPTKESLKTKQLYIYFPSSSKLRILEVENKEKRKSWEGEREDEAEAEANLQQVLADFDD